MSQTYCIIGTGVAAVNAAKAIRDYDKDGRILLIGSEPSLPYNRIKLSKDLFSDLHAEKVLIKKEKWYATQQIEVMTNASIQSIDCENQMINTSSGEIIRYDKLLLCTGAKNRKLPVNGADKLGVFTIREMHEADQFKAYIQDKTKVVTIGGGIQGLETAWSILGSGKQVAIVEVAPRLMARQLDEKISALLQKKIEAAGVEVFTSVTIKEIVGEEQVKGIVLEDKTLSCDSVVYSIGVVPNTDLTVNTPILTNRGILVDDQMETNVKGVYAAGDVTEWNGEVEGLWGRAMEQGKVAGKNMANVQEAFHKQVPFTVFNAFGLSLFSIGLVDDHQCDVTITEEDGEDKYTRIFIKNDRIVGVLSLEGVAASLPYKQAIEEGVSLVGIDLDGITIRDLMAVKRKNASGS